MLFRKKIDRYCTYCQFSGKVDEDSVICQFCGIVPCTHHCRRFRYDPLKRVPRGQSRCRRRTAKRIILFKNR
ncbi:MAG: hypothetical protein V8T01_11275 [Oscillospiraceae bacterium]